MAMIRPLHGLDTATIRPLHGPYTAITWPHYGLCTAIIRLLHGNNMATKQPRFGLNKATIRPIHGHNMATIQYTATIRPLYGHNTATIRPLYVITIFHWAYKNIICSLNLSAYIIQYAMPMKMKKSHITIVLASADWQCSDLKLCSGHIVAVLWPYSGHFMAVKWPYRSRIAAIANFPVSHFRYLTVARTRVVLALCLVRFTEGVGTLDQVEIQKQFEVLKVSGLWAYRYYRTGLTSQWFSVPGDHAEYNISSG